MFYTVCSPESTSNSPSFDINTATNLYYLQITPVRNASAHALFSHLSSHDLQWQLCSLEFVTHVSCVT